MSIGAKDIPAGLPRTEVVQDAVEVVVEVGELDRGVGTVQRVGRREGLAVVPFDPEDHRGDKGQEQEDRHDRNDAINVIPPRVAELTMGGVFLPY
jgi:hypothetical protein